MVMLASKFAFAVVVTLAFVAVLYRLEEGDWPWPVLRRLGLRLLGLCVACGGRRERHGRCFHCSTSTYYGWHLCHACARRRNGARGLGYVDEVLRRLSSAPAVTVYKARPVKKERVR